MDCKEPHVKQLLCLGKASAIAYERLHGQRLEVAMYLIAEACMWVWRIYKAPIGNERYDAQRDLEDTCIRIDSYVGKDWRDYASDYPPPELRADESESGMVCEMCGFSNITAKKVLDDDAEDEELANLEYVRYTCQNCGHRWHEAV